MSVSRETAALEKYLALLRQWSVKINLVSAGSLSDAWHRHIADCLQLSALRPAPGSHWLDIGSGGGLPGLVVAIATPSKDTQFTLVESDLRKATFLRRAAAELELTNTTVLSQRIEAVEPLGATTVSARALAPLPRLMAYVSRHLAPEGVALLPKGRSWKDEVREAERVWRFDLTAHPSATDQDAAVLEIRNIHAR